MRLNIRIGARTQIKMYGWKIDENSACLDFDQEWKKQRERVRETDLAIDRFQRSKLKRDFFRSNGFEQFTFYMECVLVAFWLHFIGLSLFSTWLRTISIIIWWQVIVSHTHAHAQNICLLWGSFLLLMFFFVSLFSHPCMKLNDVRKRNRIIHSFMLIYYSIFWCCYCCCSIPVM